VLSTGFELGSNTVLYGERPRTNRQIYGTAETHTHTHTHIYIYIRSVAMYAFQQKGFRAFWLVFIPGSNRPLCDIKKYLCSRCETVDSVWYAVINVEAVRDFQTRIIKCSLWYHLIAVLHTPGHMDDFHSWVISPMALLSSRLDLISNYTDSLLYYVLEMPYIAVMVSASWRFTTTCGCV
jgi:hypothetical protein